MVGPTGQQGSVVCPVLQKVQYGEVCVFSSFLCTHYLGKVIYLFLDGSGCNDVQEDTAYKTPNDIVYMR